MLRQNYGIEVSVLLSIDGYKRGSLYQVPGERRHSGCFGECSQDTSRTAINKAETTYENIIGKSITVLQPKINRDKCLTGVGYIDTD